MCRGKLFVIIFRVIPKGLWNGWKRKWRVKEISFPFPCYTVSRECSWKKIQIEKKFLITPKRYVETENIWMLKINIFVTSTKKVKFFSSFSPIFLRQEMEDMESQGGEHLWNNYNPLVLRGKVSSHTCSKKTTQRIVLLVLILEYLVLK